MSKMSKQHSEFVDELRNYLQNHEADPDAKLELDLDSLMDTNPDPAERACILHQLTEIIKIFYNESCGRCVFGYDGLFQIQTILSDITNKKGKSDDLDLIAELGSVMQTECLCDIGRAAAEFAISAINAFEPEIKDHITRKTCKSAFCQKFVTYHILKDKCVGCEECVDVCNDDAIDGKRKFVHVIDQDECTQCGKCMEACEYGAIVKAGAIKPKCPPKPIPCTAKA